MLSEVEKESIERALKYVLRPGEVYQVRCVPGDLEVELVSSEQVDRSQDIYYALKFHLNLDEGLFRISGDDDGVRIEELKTGESAQESASGGRVSESLRETWESAVEVVVPGREDAPKPGPLDAWRKSLAGDRSDESGVDEGSASAETSEEGRMIELRASVERWPKTLKKPAEVMGEEEAEEDAAEEPDGPSELMLRYPNLRAELLRIKAEISASEGGAGQFLLALFVAIVPNILISEGLLDAWLGPMLAVALKSWWFYVSFGLYLGFSFLIYSSEWMREKEKREEVLRQNEQALEDAMEEAGISFEELYARLKEDEEFGAAMGILAWVDPVRRSHPALYQELVELDQALWEQALQVRVWFRVLLAGGVLVALSRGALDDWLPLWLLQMFQGPVSMLVLFVVLLGLISWPIHRLNQARLMPIFERSRERIKEILKELDLNGSELAKRVLYLPAFRSDFFRERLQEEAFQWKPVEEEGEGNK